MPHSHHVAVSACVTHPASVRPLEVLSSLQPWEARATPEQRAHAEAARSGRSSEEAGWVRTGLMWGHEFGLNLYTFLRSAHLCCLQVPRQAGTLKGSCPLSCQKAPHRRRGACRAEGPPGPLQTRGGGRGL